MYNDRRSIHRKEIIEMGLSLSSPAVSLWQIKWAVVSQSNMIGDICGQKVSSSILDNSISHLSCSPLRSSKGHPSWVSVLLQEETGVSGENLRCLVESNWTTLFSHVTKVTFNQITARSRNQTLVTVVRNMCPSTTVPPALQKMLSEVCLSTVIKYFSK